MNERKVKVIITKQNEDGETIGKPRARAYVITNEDGSSVDDLDAKDWFEDSFPIDGTDRTDRGFIGYKATDTGFIAYELIIK